MIIAGVSVILILGVINFMLLLFQVATGLRWFKVHFGVHRKTGLLLFGFAVIHGILGILVNI